MTTSRARTQRVSSTTPSHPPTRRRGPPRPRRPSPSTTCPSSWADGTSTRACPSLSARSSNTSSRSNRPAPRRRKAAGPVKVEKIPERAAKQTPPVEASVAKRIAATQKRSRRVDERVAPSETDSVLGDDQPGQNPARLVDDRVIRRRDVAVRRARGAEPFDDVPVIMGGWNEYAGVPKPERETSRPTFKARDPHEISGSGVDGTRPRREQGFARTGWRRRMR